MSDRIYEADVAVIGGGMGGVAAALAACEAGATVVLSEATDWIGGQMTSQGVSAFDEHPHIERFGGTRAYYRLRNSIRAFYQTHHAAPATMPDGAPLNPGNGWVSRLCFEPRVGLLVLQEMLQPYIEAGRLTILLEHRPLSATTGADRIHEVVLTSPNAVLARIRAAYFLDATELGDLLPLVNADYVTGAEAREDTGEPHASPDGPRPDEVQSFTFCFAVEHRPGEDHTIPRPNGYERFRDQQPYTLVYEQEHGSAKRYRVFAENEMGPPPFWTYRRLVDGALVDPSGKQRDIAMINWASNDYHYQSLIDRPPREQAGILDEARRLSLGFLYWLQTEVPRDDGSGRGYPGLRLLPEVMGTKDGLSKAPYIRESRRIRAVMRVVEGQITAQGRRGARAEQFEDSIGVGWYPIDVHGCVGNPRASMYAPTLPFQIPLGALLPRRLSNLLAACKNIGTTHLTNGAYRLHPVEWNIGEAAGALAAYCCAEGHTPLAVWSGRALLRKFQRLLLERGVPLAWAVDIPLEHRLFVPAQVLLTLGALPAEGRRFSEIELRPDEPATGADVRALLRTTASAAGLPLPESIHSSQRAGPHEFVERLYVEEPLRDLGLNTPALSDRPRWGELCLALQPLLERESQQQAGPNARG